MTDRAPLNDESLAKVAEQTDEEKEADVEKASLRSRSSVILIDEESPDKTEAIVGDAAKLQKRNWGKILAAVVLLLLIAGAATYFFVAKPNEADDPVTPDTLSPFGALATPTPAPRTRVPIPPTPAPEAPERRRTFAPRVDIPRDSDAPAQPTPVPNPA